ncbi:MAG: PAS domain S-box protein [Ignavibacteriaceae bacterium]
MAKFFYKQNKLLVYSYSLFILIFLAFSFYFYINEKKNENLKNRGYLQTLAKIKSNEITQWHSERLSDALSLYSNEYLKQELINYSAKNSKSDSLKIVSAISQTYKNHDYKNIFILNKNRDYIINLNPASDKNYNADSVSSAIRKDKIVISNFYINQSDFVVDIDLYIPVKSKGNLISVIIMKIDPARLIFPLIQNWYLPNSSAESFIVFRQKDSVVFINKLKYSDVSPLRFKLPALSKNLPSASAVRGIRGIVEGIDYRGEKVLADIRHIKNTPWYLITKQDLSEIYLPATNRLSFILLLLFSVYAIGGISFLYYQSKQNFKYSSEINESIKKFELLYQTSNDAIMIIEDNKIIDCNIKAEKIFQTEKNNILKRSLMDFSPQFQSDGSVSEEKLLSICKDAYNGKACLFEWVFSQNDKHFNSEINLSPLVTDNKHFIVAVIRDITNRKKIEEQNLRLLHAVEQSPTSIVITNTKGDIEYVNPKFSEITGYSRDEVIGKNPRVLKSGEGSAEVYKNLWETIVSGSEWRGEFHNRKKNGKLYWEMASISPVRNSADKITHYIAIKEDITEAKEIQESLKKLAAELTQQNKYLEQFAYIISHNLRSPVANIIGIIETLKDSSLTKEEEEELMSGLFFSSKKLDEVILELNNILQIKKGVNEVKEKVEFTELLKDIKDSISNLIRDENVKILSDFSEADEIFTLKSYLRSIFYNLITNSIKYKQPGEQPVIEIRSRKIDKLIRLTFKDNGLGFNLNEIGNQVFGIYRRFHDHKEGKGLGLFMTKMQVEALSGKISINSEVNKGTEFTIDFDI